MIVYNLSCDQNHPFEGWFGSAEDMASQQARGLLACPLCGSHQVQKMLSAPRLNLLSSEQRANAVSADAASAAASTAVAQAGGTQPPSSQAMLTPEHAKLADMLREFVANTEDVGQKFPEEARRIHYKEAPARSIRGVASKREAEALAEEGIEVAQLPFLVTPKSELN